MSGVGDQEFYEDKELFVSNVPDDWPNSSVQDLFAKYGTVIDLRLNSILSGSGRKIKCGFVVYSEPSMVRKALQNRPICLPNDPRHVLFITGRTPSNFKNMTGNNLGRVAMPKLMGSAKQSKQDLSNISPESYDPTKIPDTLQVLLCNIPKRVDETEIRELLGNFGNLATTSIFFPFSMTIQGQASKVPTKCCFAAFNDESSIQNLIKNEPIYFPSAPLQRLIIQRKLPLPTDASEDSTTRPPIDRQPSPARMEPLYNEYEDKPFTFEYLFSENLKFVEYTGKSKSKKNSIQQLPLAKQNSNKNAHEESHQESKGSKQVHAKEEPSQKVFVGNLPGNIDTFELVQIFSKFGTVVNVNVYDCTQANDVSNSSRPTPKFGFIVFKDQSSVQRAIMSQPITLLSQPTHKLVVQEKRGKNKHDM